MWARVVMAAGMLALLTGCPMGNSDPPVIAAKPVVLADGTRVTPTGFTNPDALRTIGFSAVQISVPRGTVIGESSYRPLTCELGRKLRYDGDRRALKPTAYNDIFHTIFKGHGYRVSGNPNAMFKEAGSEEADFEVGANISKITGDLCEHVIVFDLSGKVTVTVNWQVYDPERRRVVWQKDVEGVFEVTQGLSKDYDLFIQHAFADSANKVAADPTLRQLVVQPPPRDNFASSVPAVPSSRRLLIPRQGQRSGTIDTHIDHLRSATVLIDNGAGHGSGFLVREDGLVVTNQHVVRSQRFVKVTLVSGRTAVGEVLYKDELRDVALVKIEGSGYPVVSVRETPVRIAEEVYAIGAPKFQSLSWSVTRGVVSAYRQAGRSGDRDLIQADVAVHGGNSGGPLFNRHGNVVAICVSGVGRDNMSLNFFIPILDGLNKLGLDLVDPAAYERARRTAAAN